MTRFKKLLPLLFLFPLSVLAKNFTADFAVTLGESDNALKSTDNQISEKQSRYNAAVFGDWQSEWFAANIRYDAYREEFADDSQDGQNYLQGDSLVHFGNPQKIFNLDLKHSRRTLLKELDEVSLSENQEDREIISAVPSINIDLTSRDELIAYGDISQARYLETELRNADRNTYGTDWVHDFTAVDTFSIQLSQSKTEFDFSPQLDYSLNRAAATYSAELRRLSYSIGGGREYIKPEIGEEHESGYYKGEVSYQAGRNQWQLMAERSVTDTAFGSGSNIQISPLPGVDTIDNQAALLDRKTLGINLTSQMLCSRCNLSVGANQYHDLYIDAELESKQKNLFTSVTYDLSTRSQLGITYSRSHQQPEEASLAADYKQHFSRAFYRYRFMKSMNFEVFVEREKRQSDTDRQNYTEKFIGVLIGYHFE